MITKTHHLTMSIVDSSIQFTCSQPTSLILSSHLYSGLPRGLFCLRFSNENFAYISHFLLHAIDPSYLITLCNHSDHIRWRVQIMNFPSSPINSFVGTNILLCTVFSLLSPNLVTILHLPRPILVSMMSGITVTAPRTKYRAEERRTVTCRTKRWPLMSLQLPYI